MRIAACNAASRNVRTFRRFWPALILSSFSASIDLFIASAACVLARVSSDAAEPSGVTEDAFVGLCVWTRRCLRRFISRVRHFLRGRVRLYQYRADGCFARDFAVEVCLLR